LYDHVSGDVSRYRNDREADADTYDLGPDICDRMADRIGTGDRTG
jgi:hypothetical protein